MMKLLCRPPKPTKTNIALAVLVIALFATWATIPCDWLAWAKYCAVSAKDFIGPHAFLYAGLYVLLCAVVINSPLPLAALLKVSSGFVFGGALGFSVNVLASTLGGAVGFVVSRHVFRKQFERRYGQRMERVNAELEQHGLWYVLTCRLATIMPFFMVNILAGLSRMRLGSFAVATFFGVIPSSTFYAMTGRELDRIQTLSDLMHPRMVLLLGLLAVAALLPVLAKRLTCRKA